MSELDKVLDQLVAGDEEKAKETFHSMVVQQSRDEFNKLAPEEIAYPRSVNGVRKFYSDSSIYRKGTPMHIKGALVYNHMICLLYTSPSPRDIR